MIQEAIIKIVDKQDLSYDEAYQVMNEIMSGETSPTQNAAFLAALSTKSTKAETIVEIAGCAAAMRNHACGIRSLVPPLAKAALAVGADGLMIEVHNDPAHALCDGAQSLNPSEFNALMLQLKQRASLEEKNM